MSSHESKAYPHSSDASSTGAEEPQNYGAYEAQQNAVYDPEFQSEIARIVTNASSHPEEDNVLTRLA
ncbi:hypothetical protein WICPIJ_008960, partial [Wickerhamomyces pijperi]